MSVYKAINNVQRALSVLGISKDKRNTQQGYNFRGIDDIYNVVSPLLAEHGLCILPSVQSRECVERVSAKGGALFYVTVAVEFAFVATADGSTHTVRTFGEAMDSADKATNKAMSAAYKYAVMQAFAIPTEGDNDADAHTHEVVAAPPAPPPAPRGFLKQREREDWAASIAAASDGHSLADVKIGALTAASEARDESAYNAFRALVTKRALELTQPKAKA